MTRDAGVKGVESVSDAVPEKRPDGERSRRVTAAASGLAAFGLVLFVLEASPTPWLRWLALTCTLFGGSLAWSSRTGSWRVRWALSAKSRSTLEWMAPYALVFVASVWVFWPMSVGELPISQDHAEHYLQTRIFLDDFLLQGRMIGWTDKLHSGIPFGDTYPNAVYLIPGALHLLSFGLISLQVSYALGVFAIWVGLAWAAVAWTRYLVEGGSDGGQSWLVPALAGLLVLIDPGGDREGGWIYSQFHAVWPQIAGITVGMWGLLGLLRLAERPTYGRLAVAVVVYGCSLWCHFFNGVITAVAAPLLVLVLAWSAPGRRIPDPHRATVWVLIAFVGAIAIGLGWLSHVISVPHEDLIAVYAGWGHTPEIANRALEGRLFAHQQPLVGIGALLGAAMLATRRRPLDVFVLSFAAILLLLGSGELWLAFDVGSHENNQPMLYPRFGMPLKPLYYTCAAIGLGLMWRTLRDRLPGAKADAPRLSHGHRAVLAVLAAPLLSGALASAPDMLGHPTGKVLTRDDAHVRADIEALTELLREERAVFTGSGHVPRVIRYKRAGKTFRYEMFAIADAGFGQAGTHDAPATAYRWKNRTTVQSFWRRLGATVVISEDDLHPTGLKQFARAGRYRLLRLQDAPRAPVHMKGPGEVEVVEWGDEIRRLRVRGVTEKSAVILAHPPYHRWRATLGGEPVEVVKELEPNRLLSRLDYHGGLRDGELVVEYQYSLFERVSLAVSLTLCIVLLFVGLLFGRRMLPSPLPARLLRLVPRLATGGALIFLLGLWLMGTGVRDEANSYRWLTEVDRVEDRRRSAEQRKMGRIVPHRHHAKDAPPRRELDASLLSLLHREPLELFALHPEDPCHRPFSRNPRPGCRDRTWSPRLTSAPARSWPTQTPTCLELQVPALGSITVGWTPPPDASRLHWVLHMRGKNKSLESSIGPAEQGARRVMMRADGKLGRMPLDRPSGLVRVRVDNPTKRYQKLCLELAALDSNEPLK